MFHPASINLIFIDKNYRVIVVGPIACQIKTGKFLVWAADL